MYLQLTDKGMNRFVVTNGAYDDKQFDRDFELRDGDRNRLVTCIVYDSLHQQMGFVRLFDTNV